ncbi:MAG: hypothetical protein ABIO29_07600 [Sphingomicrobium sp.]
MIRYATLIALPLLAACDIETRNPADGDSEVAINGDAQGKVAFNLPFAKGELNLPQGMMTKGDIDIDGVKLMPGSKVTGFSVMAEDNKDSTVNIGFSAPRSPAEVRAYFVSEFAKSGAQTTANGASIAAKTKNGDDITIAISPDGAGSKGMIAIRSAE